MRGRVLLAGLIAGVALFVWLGFAHMVLPLGTTGISELSQEDAVVTALQANVHNSGFYIFPSGGMLSAATPEAKKAAQEVMMKKMASGPHGILIFHPSGSDAMSPKQLVTELAANIVEAMLAVWLISLVPGLSFAGKVCFGTTIGIVTAMMTNISYWNWYGFPGRYTIANMATQIAGFVVVGLVSALMMKRKAEQMVGAGK